MLSGRGGKAPSLLCESEVHPELEETKERQLAAPPTSGQRWLD